MIKAAIIDDEKDAAEFVHSLVNEYCPEIIICGKAHSADDGINLITDTKPDLVFLDVEMPKGNAFYMLEKIQEINFKIIFITAYNNYALRAIKFSAVDYILKPVNIKEFLQAVEKVKQEISASSIKDWENYKMLLENLKHQQPTKLAIPSLSGMEFIEISQIVRIEAARSYCNLMLSDGRTMLISKSMADFQMLSDDYNFFKPHKSHLINLTYVNMYVKKDGGYIIMKDNTTVPLSINKKDSFMEKMKSIALNLPIKKD